MYLDSASEDVRSPVSVKDVSVYFAIDCLGRLVSHWSYVSLGIDSSLRLYAVPARSSSLPGGLGRVFRGRFLSLCFKAVGVTVASP